MCDCCKCTNNTENLLEQMNERYSKQNEYLRIKEEYVARNLPFIIDLVGRYNEVMRSKVETREDALNKEKILKSLAVQICKYTY